MERTVELVEAVDSELRSEFAMMMVQLVIDSVSRLELEVAIPPEIEGPAWFVLAYESFEQDFRADLQSRCHLVPR